MAEVAVLLWCTQSHNTDHLQCKNSSLLVLLERDIGRGRCMEPGLEYRRGGDKDGDEDQMIKIFAVVVGRLSNVHVCAY